MRWRNGDQTLSKAVYTLTKERKRRICDWICCLGFSVRYASNLARCVDMMELRMHGMKSYDCHIFIQKLIPITFCGMLPVHVWSSLMEMSLLFSVLCSTMLDVTKLHELKGSVAAILCNLENISSSFVQLNGTPHCSPTI